MLPRAVSLSVTKKGAEPNRRWSCCCQSRPFGRSVSAASAPPHKLGGVSQPSSPIGQYACMRSRTDVFLLARLPLCTRPVRRSEEEAEAEQARSKGRGYSALLILVGGIRLLSCVFRPRFSARRWRPKAPLKTKARSYRWVQAKAFGRFLVRAALGPPRSLFSSCAFPQQPAILIAGSTLV